MLSKKYIAIIVAIAGSLFLHHDLRRWRGDHVAEAQRDGTEQYSYECISKRAGCNYLHPRHGQKDK